MNVLDAIRKRAEAYRTHGTPGLHAPQDRAKLLEAVETVLDVHKARRHDPPLDGVFHGQTDAGQYDVCKQDQLRYPCPTITAVVSALGGGE